MPDYIFRPSSGSDTPDEQLLGGKGFNLAQLVKSGATTAPWFAVTTRALSDVLRKSTRDQSPESIRESIRQAQFPETLVRELRTALSGMRADEDFLAVRSSAVGEDGAGLSYAGQLESFLFVHPDDVPEYVREVWLSAYSDRVFEYRRRNGLPPVMPGVAVIVQKMINAEVSGVAFGIDPLTGEQGTTVISSLFGLGEGLVSGAFDADRYTVRDGRIESEIAHKPQALSLDTERSRGTQVFDLPEELQDASSLSQEEIAKIVQATNALNSFFEGPQDVEWSIAEDQLYILQSRPVTAVTPAPEGAKIIWDNSNIIESYSGVTTPLTFSFIEGVYTEVYRELTRILGVTDKTIESNEKAFRMLGLIRGRVYYNLLNWYRVLALLPGYRVNAGFMESMMGVKERLEEQPDIVPPEGNQILRIIISVYRLITNLLRLPREITRFHDHLNRTLEAFEGKDLKDETPEQLVAHYDHLQSQLLQRWRTPILNDFYTMIFHGLLRKMIGSWKLDDADTLHNNLLIGEGDIISTEPIRRLEDIAAKISADKELASIVQDASPALMLETLDNHAIAGPALREYLSKFGNRCAGELKLETITPQQEPERIAETIRNYVRSDAPAGSEVGRSLRREAEAKIFRGLKGHPIRSFLFKKILRAARERVKGRENLRFERTRVFAVVREIFLGLGAHLAKLGLIDSRRDVFYLGIHEVFALVNGTALSARPKEIVDARRREFEAYQHMPSPPDRFETHGPVAANRNLTPSGPVPETTGDSLRGTPCCPGVVTGPVRIVTDPTAPVDLRGHILVAERTDPGWAPLFPLATGLLVERGSLLSHSAIVAREMGIPAIVAVPELLRTLRDGEKVTMDGARGTIVRHESETEESESSEAGENA